MIGLTSFYRELILDVNMIIVHVQFETCKQQQQNVVLCVLYDMYIRARDDLLLAERQDQLNRPWESIKPNLIEYTVWSSVYVIDLVFTLLLL